MAKVIKRFRCKLTQKSYVPGQIYEADKERIEYLQNAGYLDDTPHPIPENEPEQVEELTGTVETVQIKPEELVVIESENKQASDFVAVANTYQLMTKKELCKELTRRRIKFNERQTKTELIGLLQKERMGDE